MFINNKPEHFLFDIQSVEGEVSSPSLGVGSLLLGKGKVSLTNSPGVNNSGKVKIPANPLLFGQRKANSGSG